MKKRTVQTLLCILILLMTGCGNMPEPAVYQEKETVEATLPEETREVQSGVVPPEISIAIEESAVRNGEGQVLSYLYYESPVLHTEGYEKLKEGLTEYEESRAVTLKGLAEKYASDAASVWGEQEEYRQPYSVYQKMSCQRVDEKLASFSVEGSDFTGGAHPMHTQYGVTFDSQTGKQLEFSDIVKDYALFQSVAKPFVMEYLKPVGEEGYLFEEYEETVEQRLKNPVWYMSGQGMTLIFEYGLIGPYALGNVEVAIPYEIIGASLQPEYLSPEKSAVLGLKEGRIEYMDITGDGVLDDIEFLTEWDENSIAKCSIRVNDSVTNLGEFVYLNLAYVIRTRNGTIWFLMDEDTGSEDYKTFLYEMQEETFVLCDEITGRIKRGTVSKDGFTAEFYLDVLGTYQSSAEYKITGKELISERTLFSLQNDEVAIYRKQLITKKEIPATLRNVQTVLAPGTRIYPKETDNNQWLYFILEDGTEGKLEFERRGEWDILIDGMDQFEVFEELPYSG